MTARVLISGFMVVFLSVFYACETTTEPISDLTTDISVGQVESYNAKSKVDICHATSSSTNPWILISVSEKAVDKHISKHGDLYPGDRIDDETVLSEECIVLNDSESDDGPLLNEKDETTETDGDGDTCIGGLCF